MVIITNHLVSPPSLPRYDDRIKGVQDDMQATMAAVDAGLPTRPAAAVVKHEMKSAKPELGSNSPNSRPGGGKMSKEQMSSMRETQDQTDEVPFSPILTPF